MPVGPGRVTARSQGQLGLPMGLSSHDSLLCVHGEAWSCTSSRGPHVAWPGPSPWGSSLFQVFPDPLVRGTPRQLRTLGSSPVSSHPRLCSIVLLALAVLPRLTRGRLCVLLPLTRAELRYSYPPRVAGDQGKRLLCGCRLPAVPAAKRTSVRSSEGVVGREGAAVPFSGYQENKAWSVSSNELETRLRGSAYRTAFTPEEATGSSR